MVRPIKWLLSYASFLLFLVLPATGESMGIMPGHGIGMMGGSLERHVYYMRHGLPPAYGRMKNPLQATAENFSAGKKLFEKNCVVCHGETGRGDGAAASGMKPAPADLSGISRMPMMSDGYLYWVIAEGGTQFKTAMPAMKGSLKKTDIWKLVLYLRKL